MRWRVLAQPSKKRKILEVLLENRGLKTKKQQERFLAPPKPWELTPSEVGLSTFQLNKAVKRILKAIERKERIVVYGDYDADGVCATAILQEALLKVKARVVPFIPTRREGYGLKVARIKQLAREGTGLIVTVDQGIVHHRQVKSAQKLGVEVVVTDHHLPGKEKPSAEAVVHSSQLSGAGVAWFLAKKITAEAKKHQQDKDGLDLATIGTVADVMPLLGPNRSLVKYGLKSLQKTRRKGLLALYRLAGIDRKKINTYTISFLIAPRLNAAGRIDDPTDSLKLICTSDKQKAFDLAQRLEERNQERQRLTEKMVLHARRCWLENDGQSALIFVEDHSYQEGVAGLVASKLVEEFYRPAVVVAKKEPFSRASARSIEEFNIVEALRACADLLGTHGGHSRAAGFTIETTKIGVLKERLIQLAKERLDEAKLTPQLRIDAEVGLEKANLKLYYQLAKMEPFGEGNPRPVFLSRKVKVIEAQTVGSENQHLSLRLQAPDSKFQIWGIGFGLGHFYHRLSPERPVDIAWELLLERFNHQKRLKLKIRDIKVKI